MKIWTVFKCIDFRGLWNYRPSTCQKDCHVICTKNASKKTFASYIVFLVKKANSKVENLREMSIFLAKS